MPRTPWWLAVRGACWWAPCGPGSDLDGLADHPVVLDAIKEELVRMRKAGVALGVPIARVLIKNKLEELMPQLLKPAGPLGVGKSWTTRFLARELDWSYR